MDTPTTKCQFHDDMINSLHTVIQNVFYDLVTIDNHISQCLPVVQPPPGFHGQFQPTPGMIYNASRRDQGALPLHFKNNMELMLTQINYLLQLQNIIHNKLMSSNQESTKPVPTHITNISIVTGNSIQQNMMNQQTPLPNQLPQQSVNNQLPQPSVNNQFTQQSVNNQFQQQSVNNHYQQQSINNHYQQQSANSQHQQQSANNQFPQQSVNNQFPQQSVNNQFPQQSVNNQFSLQSVNNQYQQQSVNNNYQQQSVNNNYQQQSVNNQVPQQSVNNQFPQQSVNNQFLQHSVNNQFPQQPVNNHHQQLSVNNQYQPTLMPNYQLPPTPIENSFNQFHPDTRQHLQQTTAKKNTPAIIAVSSCSCSADIFRQMYWFCNAVCSQLQHIQNQCQNLDQTLSRTFSQAEINILSQLSKMQQSKSLIHAQLNLVYGLGKQGIDICSNIQLIKAPGDKSSSHQKPDSHTNSSNHSNTSDVHQSSPLFPSVQSRLDFTTHQLDSTESNNQKAKPQQQSSTDSKGLQKGHQKPVKKLKKSASCFLKKIFPQKKVNSVSPAEEQASHTSSQRDTSTCLTTALSIINNQEAESPFVSTSKPSTTAAIDSQVRATSTPVTTQTSSVEFPSMPSAVKPVLPTSNQTTSSSINSTSTIQPSNQTSSTSFQHVESTHPIVNTPSLNQSSSPRPAIKSVRALINDIEKKFLQPSSASNVSTKRDRPLISPDAKSTAPQHTTTVSNHQQPSSKTTTATSLSVTNPATQSDQPSLASQQTQQPEHDSSVPSSKVLLNTSEPASTSFQADSAQPSQLKDGAKPRDGSRPTDGSNYISSDFDSVACDVLLSMSSALQSPSALESAFLILDSSEIDIILQDAWKNSTEDESTSKQTADVNPMSPTNGKTNEKADSHFITLDQIFSIDRLAVTTSITKDLQDCTTELPEFFSGISDLSPVPYDPSISESEKGTSSLFNDSTKSVSCNTQNEPVTTNPVPSSNTQTEPTATNSVPRSKTHIETEAIMPVPTTNTQIQHAIIKYIPSTRTQIEPLTNKPAQIEPPTVSQQQTLDQHLTRTPTKRLSPIVTRLSTRKRLFEAVTSSRKNSDNLDDIVPLEDQPSASKYKKKSQTHDRLAADDMVSSTTSSEPPEPCSPSTLAEFISDKYKDVSNEYMGKGITNTYPAKNSRTIMECLLTVHPIDIYGNVNDNRLIGNIIDAMAYRNEERDCYNCHHHYDRETKQIISQDKIDTAQPHLYARDLVWKIFTLGDLCQCLQSKNPCVDLLDQDIIRAIKSTTMKKFGINEETWNQQCVKKIRQDIRHTFYTKLNHPVFEAAIENRLRGYRF